MGEIKIILLFSYYFFMVKEKPGLSKEFEKSIYKNSKKGIYRINKDEILIDVFSYVFPPASPFSESSHSVYDLFGNLSGQQVLDIGTGTGILAIYAAKIGALHVDAVDINDVCVDCAKHNVQLNSLEDIVDVWRSDLFDGVQKKKYDLIIANLPIVDFDEDDLKLHSLYDPDFKYHKRLFSDAKDYLCADAPLVLCHADLQTDGFERLESLADKYGYIYSVRQKINSLGHEWRNYEFKVC